MNPPRAIEESVAIERRTDDALWELLAYGPGFGVSEDHDVARREMRKRLDARASELAGQIARSINDAGVLPGVVVTAAVERVGPDLPHWDVVYPSKYEAIYDVTIEGSIPINSLAEGDLAGRIGQVQGDPHWRWGGPKEPVSPDLVGYVNFELGMAVLDLKDGGVYEPGTFRLQIGQALGRYRAFHCEQGLAGPDFFPGLALDLLTSPVTDILQGAAEKVLGHAAGGIGKDVVVGLGSQAVMGVVDGTTSGAENCPRWIFNDTSLKLSLVGTPVKDSDVPELASVAMSFLATGKWSEVTDILFSLEICSSADDTSDDEEEPSRREVPPETSGNEVVVPVAQGEMAGTAAFMASDARTMDGQLVFDATSAVPAPSSEDQPGAAQATEPAPNGINAQTDAASQGSNAPADTHDVAATSSASPGDEPPDAALINSSPDPGDEPPDDGAICPSQDPGDEPPEDADIVAQPDPGEESPDDDAHTSEQHPEEDSPEEVSRPVSE